MSTPNEQDKMNLNYCSYKKPVTSPPGAEKPLPKVTIDGHVVEFMPGDTIMQAAERAALSADIPRYCYHPGLPIAGTCRMCTVEVEKAPKLMTSCSTPAADGMVVHTQSDRVRKSRTGVMEFLLTNHPLDCPVCDKAGECELQNYNYEYGPGTSRFKEEKRVWEDSTTKKLSEKITLNMNRCVHCERCVRFTEDVTKTFDLVMLNRGWHKELAVADEEKGLFNDYQGCLTDFCPVGALTFNDFRFQKRAWFLRHDQSLCDGCSKGCNIETHSHHEVIYRMMPVFNEKVNGHWMCDEGRLTYHTTTNPERVVSPLMQTNALAAVDWSAAISELKNLLGSTSRKLFLIGTDVTCEEAELLQKASKGADLAFYNGTGGSGAQDNILRQKDKTPNTKGVEALGIKALDESKLSQYDLVMYVRFGRAAIPSFKNVKNLILFGVWNYTECQQVKEASGNHLKMVLPGLMTTEKSGSYINCDGIKQHFRPAVSHKGHGRELSEVL